MSVILLQIKSSDRLKGMNFADRIQQLLPDAELSTRSFSLNFDPEKLDYQLELVDLLESHETASDKPAETKEQVIADAKIQIENMMRRLRVLNVEENILAPELPPRTPAENLSTVITRAVNGEPAWPALYKHLSAALREAERLTPQSKLTDDESGETD